MQLHALYLKTLTQTQKIKNICMKQPSNDLLLLEYPYWPKMLPVNLNFDY